MTGYVRKDTTNNIADGNVINAADLDSEFDGVQAAFNSSTGHTHDGTASEGAPITKLGPAQDVTISTTVLGVKTTNTVDLGTSSLKFKDFYLAGNASIGGTLGVTGTATFTGAVIFNGNATIGDADTDTITQTASYVTGTQLKSAKTATNTLSLAAYDVDGTAYTNLITLTASNTPTLALTSTGVGTINNMSIGATTASTGAFTTLTSNGATTFTAGTASTTTGTGTLVITGGLGVSGRINAANFDGIVGANTAAAGSFTTLSSTGNSYFATSSGNVGIGTSSPSTKLTVYAGADGDVGFFRGGSIRQVQIGTSSTAGYINTDNGSAGFEIRTNGTSRVYVDNSGNLGLGVTPSAWASFKSMDVNDGGAGLTSSGQNCYLTTNAYYNSGWKYKFTTVYGVSWYEQFNGQHAWFSAPSGTAGNAISATQAMTLDASSRLLVGLTSSLNGNGAVQAGGFSDTRVVIDGSSTQGIFFTKSGADNGTYRVDASGNYNWFVKGAGTANMILDVSGNLGVGTTSPATKFNVADSSNNCTITVTNSSSNFQIQSNTNDGYFNLNGSGNIIFRSGTPSVTERARIDSSGNLLVGTTSTLLASNRKLNVLGTAGGTISATGTGGEPCLEAWQQATSGNNVFHQFFTETSATSRGSITYNRGLGQVSYNITSDQRIKTNVTPANSALQSVVNFPVDQYDLIESGNHVNYGVVAQKAINFIPEMVTVPEKEEDLWVVDWSKAVPRMVKAIQEQQALITTLTARITALEGA